MDVKPAKGTLGGAVIWLLTVAGAWTVQAQQLEAVFSPDQVASNAVTGGLVMPADGIVAMFYWAPEEVSHESEFMPIGAPFPVGLLAPGIFLNFGVGPHPPIDIHTQPIHVQFRLWELSFGKTYEEAESNRTPQNGRLALVGRSRIVANLRLRQNLNPIVAGPVVVRPVPTENQCAQGVAQRFELRMNQPKTIDLLISDLEADPYSIEVVELPAHGTLSGTPPHLTYTPESGFCGPDSFTWRASDGHAGCAAVEVQARIEVCPQPGRGTVDGVIVSVTNGLTGQLIDYAEGILGQLYWAPIDQIDERAFEPAGDAFPVGLYVPGALVIEYATLPVTPSGAPANVQIRLWEASFGASYEEAVQNLQPQNGRLALVGRTEVIATPTGDPGADPPAPPHSIFIDSFTLAPVIPPTPCLETSELSVITTVGYAVPVHLAEGGDGHALTYALLSHPVYGQLEGEPPDLVYVPDPDFVGVDSFLFAAADPARECVVAPAMVAITVDGTAACPTAVARVVPPVLANSEAQVFWVIAPSGRDTLVLFEGTGSINPSGVPLSYSWWIQPLAKSQNPKSKAKRPHFKPGKARPGLTSTKPPAQKPIAGPPGGDRPARKAPHRKPVLIGQGEVAESRVPVGSHWVSLEVSDGFCSAQDALELRVITPADGIRHCLEVIEHSQVHRKTKRSFSILLEKALQAIERKDGGLGYLEMFQQKLAGYDPLDESVALTWTTAVQWVLDSLDPSPEVPGRLPHFLQPDPFHPQARTIRGQGDDP